MSNFALKTVPISTLNSKENSINNGVILTTFTTDKYGNNIQNAINDAVKNVPSNVIITPGTYDEDLTLYPGVSLFGIGSPIITGVITYTNLPSTPASLFSIIDNVVISDNFGSNEICLNHNSANLLIITNTLVFCNLTSTGIQTTTTPNSGYSLIMSNVIFYNPNIGINMTNGSKIIISNSFFTGGNIGAKTANTSTLFLVNTDCSLNTNTVITNDSSNCIINNCTSSANIISNNSSILSVISCNFPYVIITSNDSSSVLCSYSFIKESVLNNSSNNLFKYCIISSGSDSCITLNGSSQCTVLFSELNSSSLTAVVKGSGSNTFVRSFVAFTGTNSTVSSVSSVGVSAIITN